MQKLATMLIWKEVVSVSGGRFRGVYPGHAGPGPRESILLPRGGSVGIRGVRPCERHVGGHGLAHGAIPVRDDVGNHSPTQALRELPTWASTGACKFVPLCKWAPDRGMARVRSATTTASPAHPLTPIPPSLYFSHNGVANRLACPDVKLNKLDLHRIASFVKVASPPIIPAKLPCPFPKPKVSNTRHHTATPEEKLPKLDSRPPPFPT